MDNKKSSHVIRPSINFAHVADWFECEPSTSQVQKTIKKEADLDEGVHFIAHFQERQVPRGLYRQRAQDGDGRSSPLQKKKKKRMQQASTSEQVVKKEVNHDDDVYFIAHFKQRQVPLGPCRKRAQDGAGRSQPPKKRQQVSNSSQECIYVDISQMFKFSRPERSYSKKIHQHTTTTSLHFTDKASQYDGDPEELLDAAIAALFKEASHGRKGIDVFGIDFWWPGMVNSKFITYRPISSFDPAAVRLEIMKLTQSGTPDIDLTQKGRVTFHIVENLIVGSGRASHSGRGGESSNITAVTGSDLCLPKALALGRAFAEGGCTGAKFMSIRRYPAQLEKAALELMREAGVVKRIDYGIAELEQFQIVLSDYQVKVIREGGSMRPVWQGPYKGNDLKNIIALRLSKDKKDPHKSQHFDHIKRLAPFFKRYYHCAACDMAFDHPENHYVCSVRCKRCCHSNTTDCDGTESLSCLDCRMTFKSLACLNRHRVPSPISYRADVVKSACITNKLCPLCDEPIYSRTGVNNAHQCGRPFCRVCNEKRLKDHTDCYQRQVKEADINFEARTIFFDLECTFEEENDGRVYHKPNLCIAYKTCRRCWKDTANLKTSNDVPSRCTICNEDRLKIWHSIDDSSIDPVECLLDWLEEEQHRDYTLVAHNFKGYDGNFALKQVLTRSDEFVDSTYIDEPIKAGRKINSARVGMARAVDSFNFIPCGLAAFSKMFELTERIKGYFPYQFNKPDNYGYDNNLPPLAEYSCETLSKEKKAALEKWHAERTAAGDTFNLKRDLIAYCFSDVMLLAEGCIKFSEDMFTNAGVWPLHECITAASTALKCYRRRFMQKDTMIADRPICLKTKESALAHKLFAWKRHSKGMVIQDAAHGGEKRVGDYYVDGFVENGGRGLVIEVKGCYWHQHSCRYTDDDVMRGVPALRIRQRDEKREDYIRRHHDLEVHWECEIEAQLNADPIMAAFFADLVIYDPINMRYSFYGGRTETFKLRYEVELNSSMTVLYLDFCSLYPYVNKYCSYPCGGMRILTREELPISISTVEELNAAVKGFLFCRILPPRNLHVPALPVHQKGKLLFGLCTMCCEEQTGEFCTHSDEQRTMLGTWATAELQLAVEKGYKIVQCIQAIHYDDWIVYERNEVTGEVIKHGLYSAYMDSFIKLKTQASGWPPSVHDEKDKEKFLAYFLKEEGVQLEKDLMKKNGPARASSKLALNSLWGKAGENPIRSKELITSNYVKFFTIITTPGVIVQDMLQVKDSDRVQLKYLKESIATEPLGSNSLAVASYTTAYARVKLYRALEKIHPDRLLYADTDSIIFVHDTKEKNPLAEMMGDTLGRLTDELPEGSKCTGYVSQGPKVYALRMLDDAGNPSESVKCRGFTLTADAAEDVNYKQISAHVDNLIAGETKDPVPIKYFKISSDREYGVYSHYQTKGFRPVFDKRIILPDGSTRPFGWCAE